MKINIEKNRLVHSIMVFPKIDHPIWKGKWKHLKNSHAWLNLHWVKRKDTPELVLILYLKFEVLLGDEKVPMDIKIPIPKGKMLRMLNHGNIVQKNLVGSKIRYGDKMKGVNVPDVYIPFLSDHNPLKKLESKRLKS